MNALAAQMIDLSPVKVFFFYHEIFIQVFGCTHCERALPWHLTLYRLRARSRMTLNMFSFAKKIFEVFDLYLSTSFCLHTSVKVHSALKFNSRGKLIS